MNFEEYFKQNEELLYTFRGRSMVPMLDQEHDVVVIRKKGPERLKVDDVALFKRGPKFVLHRVVEVGDGEYVFLGDNCINCETGVREEDVLGVLVSFRHRGVTCSVNDPKYLSYVDRIRKTRKLRIAGKRTKLAVRRCIKCCMFWRQGKPDTTAEQ